MTVVMTAPFSWQFTDHLVPHNDSYSHIWKLAWIAHALEREPLEVFNANHFAPAPHTLAYSDPMPLLALLAAPFIWAGLHPVAVHNALVLLSYVTAGLGMFVLAFELTGTMVPSLLAGTIFTFASQRFGHISRIEILWVCWMPLAMLACYRLMKRAVALRCLIGRVRPLQGLTFSTTSPSRTYLGSAEMASNRPPPALALSRRLVGLALAAATAAVLVGPYLVVYAQMRTGERSRSDVIVRRYSATIQTYGRVLPENRLYVFCAGPLTRVSEACFLAPSPLRLRQSGSGRARADWCWSMPLGWCSRC